MITPSFVSVSNSGLVAKAKPPMSRLMVMPMPQRSATP